MSDLFEKSMRTLELPAVLEMLAQRAVSDEARSGAAGCGPPRSRMRSAACWMRRTPPRCGWGSTAARPSPA